MSISNEDAPKGQNDGSNGAQELHLAAAGECIGAKLINSCLSALRATESGLTMDYGPLATVLGADPATVEKMMRDALGQDSKEEGGDAAVEGSALVASSDGPPDAAIPPGAPASEDDPFDETMRRLVFPANLLDYYREIYLGFQDCLQSLVVPENTAMIQRALDRISAVMDEGLIDERGPVGLLIHILRKLASVPDREVARS